MNRRIIQYLAGAAMAVCLGVGLTLYLMGERSLEANARLSDRLCFEFEPSDGEETISLRCVPGDDDLSYVYLPACAGIGDVTVAVDADYPMYLDGIELEDGMGCGGFDLDEAYLLTGGDASERLVFVASAGVPTLFVRTVSGSMDAVNADKKLKEKALLTLCDSDGATLYRSTGMDKIRGRGNWTWLQEKRPYNLYLKHAADLFGMGAARKWVLLANVKDESNLRNWLVCALARKIGSYGFFAPECQFVDVYLNGRYNGLYLLCEKIEIRPERLDIPKDSWLFELDMAHRIKTLKNAFVLGDGPAIDVDSPEKCNKAQRSVLKKHLTDFQAALLSDDGVSPATGKRWLDFIDLDSFALKYLIEEISENLDAGAASQFYYWNTEDDLLYAGPCWDYDDSLGNGSQLNPNCFLAQREYKRPDAHTPWFPALWRREEFRSRVVELYKYEVLPALEAIMADEFDREVEAVRAASRVNSLRWHDYYERHSALKGGVDYLEDYVNRRVEFLSSAWIDGVEYRTIMFDFDDKSNYQFYCLPVGSTCEDIPTPQFFRLGEDVVWRLSDGTPFDTHSALYEDITLYGYDPTAARKA